MNPKNAKPILVINPQARPNPEALKPIIDAGYVVIFGFPENFTVINDKTTKAVKEYPGWKSILDAKPSPGDIIACYAQHRHGGIMYWAGTVLDVDSGNVLMLTRGENNRRFIITDDTFWIRLPTANHHS
jgi:hypothetical protein